jgi:hypothetical protein
VNKPSDEAKDGLQANIAKKPGGVEMNSEH